MSLKNPQKNELCNFFVEDLVMQRTHTHEKRKFQVNFK